MDRTITFTKGQHSIELTVAEITAMFHQIYYQHDNQTWRNTFWRGALAAKCPFDLWVYQEIIHDVQPDLIIECGTFMGGSTLYLANLFDLLGRGRIISVDIHIHPERIQHQRVEFITGSSTDPNIVKQVKAKVIAEETVLVILDSDHSKAHVLQEMENYYNIVTPGSYLIVEDSNINGHPVLPKFGPGPMEAIEEFMLMHPEKFTIDKSREKYFLTQNPNGYLRKN